MKLNTSFVTDEEWVKNKSLAMKQSELDLKKKKLSQCIKLTITGIIVQSQLLPSKQRP